MKNITRLDDAKALRAAGIPLSTPTEHREFSPKNKKKIDAVRKATGVFGKAVLRWLVKQSKSKKHDKKTHAAVYRTWGNLSGTLQEAYVEAEWVEQPDGSRELRNAEAVAVWAFVAPCGLVCGQWAEILAALEDGEEQHVAFGQGPWPLGPFPADDGLSTVAVPNKFPPSPGGGKAA